MPALGPFMGDSCLSAAAGSFAVHVVVVSAVATQSAIYINV